MLFFQESRVPSPVFCQRAASSVFPMVCAHGGDSGNAPPNTVNAFKLAAASQVECVEVDASVTADGALVAMHDRDLQRMSHSRAHHVSNMLLHELRDMDAGTGYGHEHAGQKPMLLEEALLYLKHQVSRIIVDVKTTTARSDSELAALVVDTVRRTGCTNCLVWAKSDMVVQGVKLAAPSMLAGYVVINETEALMREGLHQLLRMQTPEAVAVHFAMIDHELVTAARRGGKLVYGWTANSMQHMLSMLDAGVDAVVTNFPGRLQATMRDYSTRCTFL
eukprot:jgi/Chlat1/296/Chrsp1S03061